MAEKKVVCPLCGKAVSKESYEVHLNAEDYALKMIARLHPDWKEKDGTCKKCMEYYRELGKEKTAPTGS